MFLSWYKSPPGLLTAADKLRLLTRFELLGTGAGTPTILTGTLGVLTPVAANGRLITPTIVSVTSATITLAALVQNRTLTPEIVDLGANFPDGDQKALFGGTPEIRMLRVQIRYSVMIVAVCDGLGG